MELRETGSWEVLLDGERKKPYWTRLCLQVEHAYDQTTVYPPRDQLFAALALTPPERVRVVILGQDPYHEPGQAHGLSFSVPEGTALPRSLINIYREMREDLGVLPATSGCLIPWAQQGVLLLNSILTVEAYRAGRHRNFEWEEFTDGVIRATNGLPQPIVFLLWGGYAGKKAGLIDTDAPRLILKSAHPSPLSAYRGFFGSRPFSQINQFLEKWEEPLICW